VKRLGRLVELERTEEMGREVGCEHGQAGLHVRKKKLGPAGKNGLERRRGPREF
jgi:hypothetical protein